MPASAPSAGELILPHHLERVVAVSAAERSEAGRLAGLAEELGWVGDRQIRVIASPEVALQRLRAEVARGRVGLVLCASLDALLSEGEEGARFLDLCGLYETLVGDGGGVYDPTDPEDRRALGLGASRDRSLERRLARGRLRKARRGALGVRVPTGYQRGRDGAIVMDAEPAVQEAVRAVFGAFRERGTVAGVLEHLRAEGLLLGFRGAEGVLAWRAPNRQTVRNMLRNPIYAGAYVYGRIPDREPIAPGAWKVCLRDHHPAYLSWERFVENVQRLGAGRSPGRSRRDAARLAGLVSCGRCGRRMVAQYPSGAGRYVCPGPPGEPGCQSLASRSLDAAVLAAAADALSPRGMAGVIERLRELDEGERAYAVQLRARLTWARQQAEIAERRYLAVDPANVRVAGALEAEWEARLGELQSLERELALRRQPSASLDREALLALAREVNGDWEGISPGRAHKILTQVIDGVDISVEGESERVMALIRWCWGEAEQVAARRPVARWEQMSTWPALVGKLRAWKAEGLTAREIARRLNAEGWQTPRLKGAISPEMVRSLLSRHRLTEVRRGVASEPGVLGPNEWWLPQLAEELAIPASTLYGWLRRGRLQARQLHGDQGRWVIFMDEAERRRLLALRLASQPAAS